MTHLDLFEKKLHNRHVRILVGNEMFYGVLLDNFSHNDPNKKRSFYRFIPSQNLIAWRESEKENDHSKMNLLSSIVDIGQISWGEPI